MSNRLKRIAVRLSAEEHTRYSALADAGGATLSEWIRSQCDAAVGVSAVAVSAPAQSVPAAPSPPSPPAAPAAPAAPWRPFEARDVLSERELAELELLEKS